MIGVLLRIRMRLRTIALAILLMLSAAEAESQSMDIFVFLQRPHYRAAYNAMIGRAKVPSWMATAEAVSGGPQEGKNIKIGGNDVEGFFVCKPHDCGDEQMGLIFLRHGDSAKSVYRSNGKLAFLGSPNAAERRAVLGLLSPR